MLVVRALGHGGMGVTLLVVAPWNGRLYVCKAAKPNASSSRFNEEMELHSGCSHPRIVNFDTRVELLPAKTESPVLKAFLMEYVSGGTLRDLFHYQRPDGTDVQLRLPLSEALRILSDLVDGVQYLHNLGIRHRDLKPDNSLFDLLQGRSTKLCDFGAAKNSKRKTSITKPGSYPPLTPAYCAPEQILTPNAVDERADYFSIGCIFSEMLCGQPAFTRTIANPCPTVNSPPQGLNDIKVQYGSDTFKLVEGLLKKGPADRQTNPDLIRDAISQISKRAVIYDKQYAVENWPQLGTDLKRELTQFLFEEARVFQNDHCEQFGCLIALHSERTSLIEFENSRAAIQSSLWIMLMPFANIGFTNSSEPPNTAFLVRQLIELENNLQDLFTLINQSFPDNLQQRLNFVEADREIFKQFWELRKEEEQGFRMRRRLSPSVSDEQIRNVIEEINSSALRLWQCCLSLQGQIAGRLKVCSNQLTLVLAGLQ